MIFSLSLAMLGKCLRVGSVFESKVELCSFRGKLSAAEFRKQRIREEKFSFVKTLHSSFRQISDFNEKLSWRITESCGCDVSSFIVEMFSGIFNTSKLELNETIESLAESTRVL